MNRELPGKNRGFVEQQKLEKGRVPAGGALLRVVGAMWGKQTQQQASTLYSYVRYIDDQLDRGINPTGVKTIIQSEKTAIVGFLEKKTVSFPEEFPQRRLLFDGIRNLPAAKSETILRSVVDILDGFAIDATAIEEKKPIPQAKQRQRHVAMLMPVLNIMNELLFDTPLLNGKNEHVEKLMETWIFYDALRDLDEDLRAGLAIFPQSLLDVYGVHLSYAQPIPPEMKNLFNGYKPTVIKNLQKESKAVFETQLPKVFAVGLYLYFKTRVRKLKKSQYNVSESTKFGTS